MWTIKSVSIYVIIDTIEKRLAKLIRYTIDKEVEMLEL